MASRNVRHLRAASLGAVALGALAIGAAAIGFLAIGQLAIGRLEIGRARFRRLEIDDLAVGRISLQPAASPLLPPWDVWRIWPPARKIAARLFRLSPGE